MNPTDTLLALVAVGAGAVMPIQFAVNSHLGRALGNPILASIVSVAVSTVVFLLLAAAFVRDRPSIAELAKVPSYLFWVGGVCGAIFVLAAVVLTPRLGTAALAAFVILGQLLAASTIDHFGLLGVAAHQITPGRAVGALLVVVGAVMVRML